MKQIFLTVLFNLLLFTPAFGESHWELNIYSEQYPPFNYFEDEQAKGIAVDLLIHILKDINRPELINKITFVPWSRGYYIAEHQPNTLLFSMVRNPQREKKFLWVGPIMTNTFALVGKQKLLEKYNGQLTIDDIASLRVAVIKNDIGELLLEQNEHFRNIQKELVAFPQQAAKMLYNDRVDLWCYGIEAVQSIMLSEGYDPSEYQIIYNLDSASELYFAFNLDTPPEVVKSFRQSLARMKTSGPSGFSILDEIFVTYGIDPALKETY